MNSVSNFLHTDGADAKRARVFSGGACSVLTADGQSVRNTQRDALNKWLDDKSIDFFDPQIHPDSHGRAYDYEEDGPAEQAARAAAEVTLYQIGPHTMAAITCLEVMYDVASGKKKVILWLSGGDEAFDSHGRPQFQPIGNLAAEGPAGVHLSEYVNTGTKLRANLLSFLDGSPNFTIVRSEQEARRAIESMLQDSS